MPPPLVSIHVNKCLGTRIGNFAYSYDGGVLLGSTKWRGIVAARTSHTVRFTVRQTYKAAIETGNLCGFRKVLKLYLKQEVDYDVYNCLGRVDDARESRLWLKRPRSVHGYNKVSPSTPQSRRTGTSMLHIEHQTIGG